MMGWIISPITPGKVAFLSTTSSATSLVAQDNDQGAAEHAHPVLDAAERGGIDGVADLAAVMQAGR